MVTDLSQDEKRTNVISTLLKYMYSFSCVPFN